MCLACFRDRIRGKLRLVARSCGCSSHRELLSLQIPLISGRPNSWSGLRSCWHLICPLMRPDLAFQCRLGVQAVPLTILVHENLASHDDPSIVMSQRESLSWSCTKK